MKTTRQILVQQVVNKGGAAVFKLPGTQQEDAVNIVPSELNIKLSDDTALAIVQTALQLACMMAFCYFIFSEDATHHPLDTYEFESCFSLLVEKAGQETKNSFTTR